MRHLYIHILSNNTIFLNKTIKKDLILTTLPIIILLSFCLINYALAEKPHFLQIPQIISKIMQQKENEIVVNINTKFIASGFENKSTMAYLTITGIISNNTICLGKIANSKMEPTLILGPTQNQKVIIEPENGRISFNDNLSPLIENIPQTKCPDNVFLYVRSAIVKDVTLHLIQQNGDGSLNFNFGDLELPTGLTD